ncbi:MAG TPA: hypothetical protein VJ279_03180, partial [Hanamia sp.]|nr:hypothetical protein [Hanamia sp.]
MNIALDMMGGDFAPLEAVKGVKLFLEEKNANAHLTLIGDESKLTPLLQEYKINQSITLIHAGQVIEMNEHPTKALKEKQQSSIAIGFHLLASSKADAFISAGNTGAMLVGALYSIKAIEGVSRPAIGAYLPRENGQLSLLIDVGLNADCKPENLSQFAILGSLFAEHILNHKTPRVALINVGTEEGKGDLLCQAAYPLLKENSHVNF